MLGLGSGLGLGMGPECAPDIGYRITYLIWVIVFRVRVFRIRVFRVRVFRVRVFRDSNFCGRETLGRVFGLVEEFLDQRSSRGVDYENFSLCNPF